MARLLVSLLLSGVPLLARGNSAGADPACFDGSYRLCNLPCPNDTPRSWTTTRSDGSLFPCCPNGMDLVAPPTRSAFYSISASVNEYTPCEALTISIDVRNTDYKYLGLLLYAIRDGDATTETQVGEWLLPTETESFWTPPGCKGAAVMHSMATEKFFHEEFRFRAPATGTGTLRFRALVKHGETNGGAFYWPSASATTDGPVTADDLIIQETSKTSLPLTRWIYATKGESCEDKCGAAEDSMTCDGKAMVDALKLSGADMMQLPGTDVPSSAYSCNLPLLSKNGFPCSTRDELHANTFGDCFYRTDAVCPASTSQDLCSRSNSGRFCACKLASEGDTRGASSGKCARLVNSWQSKAGKSGATFDEITVTGNLLLAETESTAQVNCKIKIIGEKNEVYIDIEGPNDRWFAIAFGTKNMASEPYAIVVDKNGLHERRLGKHNAGTKLESHVPFHSFHEFGLVSIHQTGKFVHNRRTLSVKRPMQGANDDFYSFTTALGFLNVIVASGATSGDDEFGAYHSPLRRAAATLVFDPPLTKKPTLQPTVRPNKKPNKKPTVRPNKKPNKKPNMMPNTKPPGPSGQKKEGEEEEEEEGTKIGDVLCKQDPDHWSCTEVVDLQYSNSGGETNPKASSTVAALIATCVYSLTFSSSRNIVVAMVLMLLTDHARAHNWLNNPRGRLTMGKSFPCPPRPSPTSISFIAWKNTPFALEWTLGHPGSHVFFAMVKREDEDALNKNSEDVFNDYLNNAPKGSRSDAKGGWTYGKQYRKTHNHMHGSTDWAQPSLPKPGLDHGAYKYLTSYLVPGKAGYWDRPSSWRCHRNGKKFCHGRKLITQQYSYDDFAHKTDLRASYSNPKYPWLFAVMKYKITKRFPQMHDLAQLYFPPRAKNGEYVIQYHWRGYYDCLDVLYNDAPGPSPGGGSNPLRPELETTNEWLKVNHCEYRSSGSSKFTPNKDIKCTVIKAGSSAQECMTRCESKAWCNALNIVRLANPTDVRFPSVVNIPFNENECKKENLLLQAKDLGLAEKDAMVCYGIDASEIPVPNVGPKYLSTEDPIDPAFYSTCYRYDTVTRVVYPDLTNTLHPTPAPKKKRVDKWRTGGKCLACADVVANAEAPVTTAPKWTLADECFECKL